MLAREFRFNQIEGKPVTEFESMKNVMYPMTAVTLSTVVHSIFLLRSRASHAGKVCSGDLLNNEPDAEKAKLYLIREGWFAYYTPVL